MEKKITSTSKPTLQREPTAKSMSGKASQADIQRLIHELKIQNEQLAKARMEADILRHQYADLYDFSPVGYFTLAPNGAIRQVNLSGAAMLGLGRSEILNQPFASFLTNASRFTFEVFLEILITGKGKQICELAIQRNTRDVLWIHLEAACFEGWQICNAAAMDVSERKRAEEALRRTEATLVEAQRIFSVGSWDWDLTTDKIQFSDEMRHLVGMSLEKTEITHEEFIRLFHPDELDQIVQQLHQNAQYPFSDIEHRIIRTNGEVRSMHTRLKAYKDENGYPLRVLGTAQDITERKQIEEALKESEWRHKIVSELTADYVFVIDVDASGILELRWNSKNITHLTKQTFEELAASDQWKNTIHPDDAASLLEFIKNIPSKAEAGEFECRIFLSPGEERLVRIFVQPQTNPAGRVTTLIGAIKDITDRKKLEKFLKETNQQLEMRVEQRTAELQESREHMRNLARQVVTAQEEERKRISNELHDEAGQLFVGLKSPLFLLHEELPAGMEEHRQALMKSINLADQVAERIRSLSYSIHPPALAVMGLNLSISSLCEEFSENTEIEVNFECNRTDINGMSNEIDISFYRFAREALTNIFKHARASKVDVSLVYGEETVTLSVHDNGRGLGSKQKKTYGIGLNTIKERLDILGGELKIESTKGKGTLIQMTLPWDGNAAQQKPA